MFSPELWYESYFMDNTFLVFPLCHPGFTTLCVSKVLKYSWHSEAGAKKEAAYHWRLLLTKQSGVIYGRLLHAL